MKYRKHVVYICAAVLVISTTVICCSSENQRIKSELSAKLQALVDSMIDVESEDPIYNTVLYVESPKIRWKGAAGMADGKNEIMTADHKIKTASISKTFTATVVMQLIEEGKISLDDTISIFLDTPAVKLDSLHIYDGTSYGRQITVEQLLSHTSGIADYMEDPRFVPDVLAQPQTMYDPAMVLDMYYRYQTNKKALFPPGKGYNYSDVNYLLLAMIIEQVTGESYHAQLKSRIFDRLGMDNSYLEYHENPRGNKPMSHAFLSTIDLVSDVYTSFEWGGGGIVSTCEELNTFFRALLHGKLFQKESTLKQMLDAAELGKGGEDYDYGLGIMKRTIHGLTFYGHGGAYDCDMFYCPEKNISVCMSLNQMLTHGKRNTLLLGATKIVM